ncbi:MAG: hypothetical protein OEM67_02980 [Thermoleophilia bacterium]|nr:hypothetical protein [Thermoleophilia bacterium]
MSDLLPAYWAVKTLGPKRKLTRNLRMVATKSSKRRIVARSNARNAKRSAAKKVVRVLKPPAPSRLS